MREGILADAFTLFLCDPLLLGRLVTTGWPDHNQHLQSCCTPSHQQSFDGPPTTSRPPSRDQLWQLWFELASLVSKNMVFAEIIRTQFVICICYDKWMYPRMFHICYPAPPDFKKTTVSASAVNQLCSSIASQFALSLWSTCSQFDELVYERNLWTAFDQHCSTATSATQVFHLDDDPWSKYMPRADVLSLPEPWMYSLLAESLFCERSASSCRLHTPWFFPTWQSSAVMLFGYPVRGRLVLRSYWTWWSMRHM